MPEPTQEQIDRIVEMVRGHDKPLDVLVKLLWVLDLPELPEEAGPIIARAMAEIVGMRVLFNRAKSGRQLVQVIPNSEM